MEQMPAAPFSPLILGNQIRQDFALHYAGESMAALSDLLARMSPGGGETSAEDLPALLDEVTRVRGPYVHALPIPRMGSPWRAFAAEVGLHPALIETLAELGFQRLYTHQEGAIRAILAGRHTLLSAATGRGKTEGWLLPILQRCIEDRIAGRAARPRGAICALLMYPTKALAQDQLKRLLRYTFTLNRRLAREGLAPITVGIWDGDTPRRAADNEDYYLSRTMELLPCPLHGPDCQHLKLSYLPDGRPVPAIRYARGHEDVSFEFVYLTKDDILAAPVDLLLTNPDSINWRLFNVNALDELQLFVGQPRFIVFDEVHLYNSLFGAFVSALMKRYMRTRVALWAREGMDRATVEAGIQFIAASATVANKEDLFGQICPLIGNLALVEEEPRELEGTWPETLPALWSAGPLDEAGLLALARQVAPDALLPETATIEHVYEVIASAIDRAPVILRSGNDEESHATITSSLPSRDSSLLSVAQNDRGPMQILHALHAALRHEPMTAREAVALLQDRYPGLTAGQAEQVLDNFYLLGQGTGILEDRAHLFAWPLEGLYACLSCGRVYPAPTHVCANPDCGGRFVTRVTVCRDCGRLNLEGWFCPHCRQVHPLHASVGGERTLQEWSCPVCEPGHGGGGGTRVVWRPRYRCPRCGWTGRDRGGAQLACPRCASALEPVGLDPQTHAVDLPVVCRREGCEALHTGRQPNGRTPARCTCGERMLYYDALFDLHSVERCDDCRQLRERLPGAPCALPGHTSRRASHSLSSYVAVRPDRLIVRPLREARGKAGCCPDGTPLKHRRFLSLSRSPDHLAVTLAQYLLRRIVQSHVGAGGPRPHRAGEPRPYSSSLPSDDDAVGAGLSRPIGLSRPTGSSLPDALARAKLLAFSDSIRDMESLGRDFNEPEERLGLQSAIVHALEGAGGALTLAELHRRIVAWQESGPTFATTVSDTYWGQRLLANELIPGQYRAMPALPRHGIADVRLLADPETLSEEAVELLAELARNNHQRQDTLRRQPAFDRGYPHLEQRGLVARHVDDERGDVYVYLNPARVEVSLVGPERPMAYDGTRDRFVTDLARQVTLARQVGHARGEFGAFRVPWTERTGPFAALRAGLEQRDAFSQLAFRLSVLREPLRLEGEVYRGATDKVERRKLEADFRGTPRPNFLSTGPAMEVGIDIGDLNALLLFGTPPNVNAYLQRVGRAGRAGKRSLVISVSKTNPIDYYYYERPRELIASRPEPVPLNEHNEEVLRISLTWALQDWIAAHFWIPWQRQQVTAADGHAEMVIVAQGPEMRIDERPGRPPEVYRWSSVYHRPAQQIDLGGALAPLAWLAGPDSLYAPEPRRWLEDILGYRFCAHCGRKYAADAHDLCHGERPALAAEVFSGLIDDAIAHFQERLLAFLYRDVEAIDGEIDAMSTQLHEMGRRQSPFARPASPSTPRMFPHERAGQATDPGFVFRRAEVERALERLINYKQRLQRSRFAEAHAHSVEGKHAYSLRGTGDTAEVITWRPAGEDVLMREARDMAMALIDHHPYGVFVQGNRTYVAGRIEWESLPDLWQRKDLGVVRLGACPCGRSEIDAEGICPACGTRYVGLRKVHLYPHTARLAVAPGRERRAQPRDAHWRPSGVDATNSHADIQARILPGGFRPQAGSSLDLYAAPSPRAQGRSEFTAAPSPRAQGRSEFTAAPSPRPRGRSTYITEPPIQPIDGPIAGELSYGDLDLALLSRRYVAYYGDGGVDPLPLPYALCGECGGVLVHEGGQPVHCLFDAGHDAGTRMQVGLVNVLRTKGLRLAVAGSLALAHSLAHGLRLALQKIAGVDVRSIGEVVIGPVPAGAAGGVGAGLSRPSGHSAVEAGSSRPFNPGTVGAGSSRPPMYEVYLYDTAPGGSGACQLLVARDEAGRHPNYVEAVRVIRERVEACDCEGACPKCLMQYGCALDNSLRTLSRGEVLAFLTGGADSDGHRS